MTDFFISYNKADRSWAEWITWQLEEARYTTILQAWDFTPGHNFALEIDRATKEAERTIAVLSPDYLESPYTQSEWAAAYAKDPTGAQAKLIPVRVRECRLTGLLAQIVYTDLVDHNEAEAIEVLLATAKAQPLKPKTQPLYPGVKHTVERPQQYPGQAHAQNLDPHAHPDVGAGDAILGVLTLLGLGASAYGAHKAYRSVTGAEEKELQKLITAMTQRLAGVWDLREPGFVKIAITESASILFEIWENNKLSTKAEGRIQFNRKRLTPSYFADHLTHRWRPIIPLEFHVDALDGSTFSGKGQLKVNFGKLDTLDLEIPRPNGWLNSRKLTLLKRR